MLFNITAGKENASVIQITRCCWYGIRKLIETRMQ